MPTYASNTEIVRALQARGITQDDLADTVHALMADTYAVPLAAATDEEHKALLARSCAVAATTVTACGLTMQVAWLSAYYKDNREHLEWCLAGFLNLPLAA